ncbi:MAG TPA: hypothetical protein VN892_11310 [Solirubrobacteraceae bacterium]|jgi:hypothetical protein|nr:hypothetical protein [Solirubrobacteraceae bacterium]
MDNEVGSNRDTAQAGIIRRIVSRPAVRQNAFAVIIVVGGVLQYLYVEAKHPSMLLAIWGWIFRVLLVMALVGVVVHVWTWLRDRRD